MCIIYYNWRNNRETKQKDRIVNLFEFIISSYKKQQRKTVPSERGLIPLTYKPLENYSKYFIFSMQNNCYKYLSYIITAS